jgi:hypothetical protein
MMVFERETRHWRNERTGDLDKVFEEGGEVGSGCCRWNG